MANTLKTKLEIINETVTYYSNNPRSVKNGNFVDEGWDNCVYLNHEGSKCAFSRCCTDEGVTWLHEEIDIKQGGSSVREDFLKHLKPKYRGHNHDFWKDIQILHDFEEHWDDDDLSAEGQRYVNIIKVKYS